MEPDSTLLVILLFLLSGGLIFVAIRYRPVAIKIAAGALSVALAAVSGVAIVNDYYGYYQTWTQLKEDFTGSYPAFTAQAGARRTATKTSLGRLEGIALPGRASGISRRGLLYLPPQYFQARYAHTRFPVLELLHGSPGFPNNWVIQINLAGTMDKLIADHLAGPMIVVMPASNHGNQFQECVNAPGALDDTYISQDVPQDIRRHYRASLVSAEWGIGGFSSGGYCAANLALRHRSEYGAAAIMDGYYRPTDGPAAAALHYDPRAEDRNNPLLLAQALAPGVSPLPALYVSSATGLSKYAKGAQAFIAALHGVEAVTRVLEPGARHSFDVFRAVVPRMLSWMWTAIAPPALRVQFPVAGVVNNSSVVLPLKPSATPTNGGHGGRPATRARPAGGSHS